MKGGGKILNTNKETGSENWKWGGYGKSNPMSKEEFQSYKQQQLAGAKKGAGGILKTNVETGNWNGMRFEAQSQSDRIGIDDKAAQEKYFAGCMEIRERQMAQQGKPLGQNRPVQLNQGGGGFGNNYSNYQNKPVKPQNYQEQPYKQQQPNYGAPQQQYHQHQMERNNNEEDFDDMKGVLKKETEEKYIMENGVRKKIVKTIRYMENGDIKTDVEKFKA